jgi:hypothetical protein
MRVFSTNADAITGYLCGKMTFENYIILFVKAQQEKEIKTNYGEIWILIGTVPSFPSLYYEPPKYTWGCSILWEPRPKFALES